MNKKGFTLLEVMVATAIMGIAVVGVLSSMSASLRAASRLTAYDRAVMLGRSKMDELLTDRLIPFGATINGDFDDHSGWSARFTPYVQPADPKPGNQVLERVELEVWWMAGDARRAFPLEGFRRNVIPANSQ